MRIVADANLVLLEELFSGLGELCPVNGREIGPETVRDADVLLVRSVTRVDRRLLEQSRVRFVGSATAGFDHLDLPWIQDRGIHVSWAPGCNAPAVADYVLAALLYLVDYEPGPLQARTAAIVGCGEVGKRVLDRLRHFGVRCLLCDPPRAHREGADGFVSLEEALQADIVTLHVPLHDQGRYATRHLLDAERLSALRPNAILVNAARGPVVDNRALRKLLRTRRDLAAVLDVWEHEPLPDPRLVRRAHLATPHIAGYSLDGKIAGSVAVFEALCEFLGVEPENSPAQFIPEAPVRSLAFSNEVEPAQALRAAVTACYSILRDDSAMRAMMRRPEAGVAQGFDALRRHYPLRRDFSNLRVVLRHARTGLPAQMRAAGFKTG